MMAQPAIEMEQVACPLCAETRYRTIQSGADYGERVPGRFTLVACPACGLLYQNPRPTPAAIAACYPDDYSAYSSGGLRARRGLLGWLTRRGMERRLALLDQAVSTEPERSRRLLDVGCGAGVFLEAAQFYGGWQAEGLEPNGAAAQATRARTGLPVFHGTLEQAAYPDASFDAITLWDVLEHLHDPLASLRELRRILRPGGALFLRVPNAASIIRRICGRYWAGYDLPRHMTIFQLATLRRALIHSGYTRIAAHYTSGSYLYLIHSLRFALADRRSREQAATVHHLLYHPLARGLLGAPMLLIDRFGGGAALEALAIRERAGEGATLS